MENNKKAVVIEVENLQEKQQLIRMHERKIMEKSKSIYEERYKELFAKYHRHLRIEFNYFQKRPLIGYCDINQDCVLKVGYNSNISFEIEEDDEIDWEEDAGEEYTVIYFMSWYINVVDIKRYFMSKKIYLYSEEELFEKKLEYFLGLLEEYYKSGR